MASEIKTILDTIDGMSVTVDTVTPPVYKPAELRSSIGPGVLPVRVISPFNDISLATGTFTPDGIQMGNTVDIVWVFTDQLLYRRVGEGIGVEDSADWLFDYAAAYMDAVVALGFPNNTNGIEAAMRIMIRDNILFPRLGPEQYIGADCIWTVTEYDP